MYCWLVVVMLSLCLPLSYGSEIHSHRIIVSSLAWQNDSKLQFNGVPVAYTWRRDAAYDYNKRNRHSSSDSKCNDSNSQFGGDFSDVCTVILHEMDREEFAIDPLLLAVHGKSKHTAVWSYALLKASNAQVNL